MNGPAAVAGLPWNEAPRFRLRDRNYGKVFRETAAGLGIEEVLCAPPSPWQNAYAERLIGSIRRECLYHVIVVHESGLRRVLTSYLEYYASSRQLPGSHWGFVALHNNL